MAIDRTTSLPEAWGITLEMMENPSPRVPFVEPGHLPPTSAPTWNPITANLWTNGALCPAFSRCWVTRQ